MNVIDTPVVYISIIMSSVRDRNRPPPICVILPKLRQSVAVEHAIISRILQIDPAAATNIAIMPGMIPFSLIA